MSASNQTAGPSTSTDNFSAIFNAASTEYHRVTGKCLDTHPFAAQLDASESPKAVSDLLRTQTQAFSKFRKGDEKLMTYLDPIVHILFTFSATLGEWISLVSCRFLRYDCSLIYVSQPFPPAKTIFTGIGILLGVSLPPGSLLCIHVTPSSQAVRDVVASHDTLIRLFECIHLFLHHLNRYIGMPLMDDLTELLAKIMAQLLSILMLSTKAMMDRQLRELSSSLCGSSWPTATQRRF